MNKRNPFVGPKSFQSEEEIEYFFGREVESDMLISNVLSDQITLFLAPSGAGKSSLINAALKPFLKKEGFVIFPTARVRGNIPEWIKFDDIKNVFSFNVINDLAKGEMPPEELVGLSLMDYLGPKLEQQQEDNLEAILILDQFEEIITAYPTLEEERKAFFREIRLLVNTFKNFRILLTIREDFLAAIEKYKNILPKELRTRFRMDKLGPDAAIKAIEKPAAKAGKFFGEGVAQILVNNLRQSKKKGQTVETSFVEPVQLQVVCHELWKALETSGSDRILAEDLQKFGEIDKALINFYENAIQRIAQECDVRESKIRNLFTNHLITPGNYRGQVSEVAIGALELTKEVMDKLVDVHLLQCEFVRGGLWYELIHDRFIEPVILSNREWFTKGASGSNLINMVNTWLEADRQENRLITGPILKEQIDWLNNHKEFETEAVNEFLDACREKETQDKIRAEYVQELERQRDLLEKQKKELEQQKILQEQKNRDLDRLYKRTHARELAFAAIKNLEKDPELSLLLSLHAANITYNQDGAILSAVTEALHRSLSNERIEKIFYAKAATIHPHGDSIGLIGDENTFGLRDVQLNASVWTKQSKLQLWNNLIHFSPDGSMLAIVEYLSIENHPLNNFSIKLYNVYSQELEFHINEVGPETINAIAFSSNEFHLAYAFGNEIKVYNLYEDKLDYVIRTQFKEHIDRIKYSPDGAILATANLRSDSVFLWDAHLGDFVDSIRLPYTVSCFDFSHDSNYLAVAGRDYIAVWDHKKMERIHEYVVHENTIFDLVFSRSGNQIISVGADRVGIVYDLRKKEIAYRLNGTRSGLRSIALSPNEEFILTADDSNHSIIWNAGTLYEKYLYHRTPLNEIKFQPGTSRVLAGARDGMIQVLDYQAKEQIAEIPAHAGQVIAMDLVKNGKMLLTTGLDGFIKFWDTTELRELFSINTANLPTIRKAIFRPEQNTVAALGDNGEVFLINYWEGAQLQKLPIEGFRPFDLSFSGDGKLLAMGGIFSNYFGGMLVYNLQTNAIVDAKLISPFRILAIEFCKTH